VKPSDITTTANPNPWRFFKKYKRKECEQWRYMNEQK
jgi:hypothetical protein